jgi:Flp pilus assembly pilin Flp
LKNLLIQFCEDQKGATGMEYTLITAGFSAASISILQGLGLTLESTLKILETVVN